MTVVQQSCYSLSLSLGYNKLSLDPTDLAKWPCFPTQIGDMKELVVALIHHGSKINHTSLNFYRKGQWPTSSLNMDGRFRSSTREMEELHWTVPNVKVMIDEVKLDQHFVQYSASLPVILLECLPLYKEAQSELYIWNLYSFIYIYI